MDPSTWYEANETKDLGTVLAFVRESLARHRVPGVKVLRCEREWGVEGQPFRDSAAHPANSVAISGMHETETLAEWCDESEADARRAATEISALKLRRLLRRAA